MTDRPAMTPHQPFSLLMSVYHGDTAAQLKVALESVVCHQTNLPTELVLVRDGPVSHDIKMLIAAIDDASDVPFKIVELPENKGLAFALNEGLRHCSYEWVARMDADDYALPKRFEISLRFIENNPDISLFGAQIGESPLDTPDAFSTYRFKSIPTAHEDIISYMCFRNPLNHPSVFYRKSLILAAGGYPIIYPEDYVLWVSLAEKGYRFANLPETLVLMRTNDNFFRRRGIHILKGELAVYHKLYRAKYIGLFKLIGFSAFRTMLRLGGRHFTKWAYHVSRKKVSTGRLKDS